MDETNTNKPAVAVIGAPGYTGRFVVAHSLKGVHTRHYRE